ncbi:MAG: hypothetical protein DI536_33900 [Archangium gephyra]|uniref:RNA polymerase alpha subunit C-terminal domain-containing protein n=1 Tax=Archangium gephyra TaxID=48 RepID=A0A2W5SNX8_9BACT|nr:MAG: hypothetical protein DI536_33900 [Archangium gephyra]
MASAKSLLNAADSQLLLADQMKKSLDVLDLPAWQLSGLKNIGLKTIGDVLNCDEERFKEIPQVGAVRARRIMNAAQEAVFEYLSG